MLLSYYVRNDEIKMSIDQSNNQSTNQPANQHSHNLVNKVCIA